MTMMMILPIAVILVGIVTADSDEQYWKVPKANDRVEVGLG